MKCVVSEEMQKKAHEYCAQVAQQNGNNDSCALHVTCRIQNGDTNYSVRCGDCKEVIDGPIDIEPSED